MPDIPLVGSRFPTLRSSIVLITLALVCTRATAAPYALPDTEVHELPRSANGRDYVLYVSLPPSYATSPARHYPVVYAVDGYWDFPLLVAAHGNLTYDGAMPHCIIVGIGYGGTAPDVGALRQIDLTDGRDAYYDPTGNASGRAREFLGVITGEFIPFIESRYRVDSSFRALTGSSLGGFFAVFTMFEQPGLFQGLVAPSASLWWSSSALLVRERQFALAHDSLPTRLYLTWGADESLWNRNTGRALYDQLKASDYEGLAVAARELVGERHAGLKAESFTRGLRFIFAPLAPSPSTSVDAGYASRPALVNLSTRGRAGRGENVLIAGLVIRGFDPKRVLLRAAGPSLASLGVNDRLADPRITITTLAGDPVATNDNWSDAPNAAAIATATTGAGAFPFVSGSRDAAALITLAPGAYTVIVDSADGSEGIALVEAYEVLPW